MLTQPAKNVLWRLDPSSNLHISLVLWFNYNYVHMDYSYTQVCTGYFHRRHGKNVYMDDGYIFIIFSLSEEFLTLVPIELNTPNPLTFSFIKAYNLKTYNTEHVFMLFANLFTIIINILFVFCLMCDKLSINYFMKHSSWKYT